jgi:hypothetical protein
MAHREKHLKQLIKKVELKVIDVGMDASEENVLNSLKGFLYSITDQWIIDHLDISIVNSKFNQLYVRSITGGIQSKVNDKYEVQSFILPACSKGAIHKRDRIWICAYSEKNRNNKWEEPFRQSKECTGINKLCKPNGRIAITDKEYAQSGIRRVLNGVSNRMDRLAGLGNAIYPAVAYEIFKAIELTKYQ